MTSYDAVVLVSFGGPERHEDVIPFLENVLRGRNVPRERMLEVAEHYYHFDGRSPINDQNKEFIAALEAELRVAGSKARVYWGNRNWHPFLADTVRQMKADGVRRAVAVVTSAYGSYSACRQYREDITRALVEADARDMVIDKLDHFANKLAFAEVIADRIREAAAKLGDSPQPTRLIFTAHSIPTAMASSSPYVHQLVEVSVLAAAATGYSDWSLVYQSRSGPPTQPWLEPDVGDYLRQLASTPGPKHAVIICPVGFLSDHMEVLYDLDTEAADLCRELGIQMVRAGTPGVHARFIRLVREMIEAGEVTPADASCVPGCCPAPQRPPARNAPAT